MKKITLTFFLIVVCSFVIISQVLISDDPATVVDPNVVLEVKSTTKGMLIPRMNESQRGCVVTLKGLLVYQEDGIEGFYFYNGIEWLCLNTTITDTDGNTKIQVEESADEDIIRFDMGGQEHFRMDNGRLEVLNTGQSVFIGEGAGANDDLTDNLNTAIGYNSLHSNETGYFNTAVGSFSLQANTMGFQNTAFGRSTLNINVTGSCNTAIGYGAGVGSGNLTKATAIGYNAIVDVSNALVLGGANIKVGIGTSSPTEALDVYGNVKVFENIEFAGGRNAVAAEERLRIIRGHVPSAGTASGLGWSSQRISEGEYKIEFSQYFSVAPACIATLYEHKDNFIAVYNSQSHSFYVKTYDDDPDGASTPQDSNFDFIAVGP